MKYLCNTRNTECDSFVIPYFFFLCRGHLFFTIDVKAISKLDIFTLEFVDKDSLALDLLI